MAPHPTLPLQIAIQANVPVLLNGRPGTGKTQIIGSIAEAMARPLDRDWETVR